MTTAIRGLGYPMAHPLRLNCKGLDAATNGRYTAFTCTEDYRYGIRRRFLMASHGVGGWLCAEKLKAAGYCVPLEHHGFVVMAHTNAAKALEARAELAANGYVGNRYGIADASPSSPCVQKASDATKWTCEYQKNSKVMEVTISLKAAKGGYITTGTAAPG
jgi:hypothetical protein